VHRRVIADVSAITLQQAIRQVVHESARVMTDECPSYLGLKHDFASHESVCHSGGEYVTGDVHANAIGSSFALIYRPIISGPPAINVI
jgi:hypothetical protein